MTKMPCGCWVDVWAWARGIILATKQKTWTLCAMVMSYGWKITMQANSKHNIKGALIRAK